MIESDKFLTPGSLLLIISISIMIYIYMKLKSVLERRLNSKKLSGNPFSLNFLLFCYFTNLTYPIECKVYDTVGFDSH